MLQLSNDTSTMMVSLLFFVSVIIIFSIWFFLGFKRANSFVGVVHSRPHYHGLYVALCSVIPTLIIIAVGCFLLSSFSAKYLEEAIIDQGGNALLLSKIKDAIAAGNTISLSDNFRVIADNYVDIKNKIFFAIIFVGLFLSIIGGIYSLKRLSSKFRSRTRTEKFFKAVMLIASMLAIFVTVGIVLTLIFEAIRFFIKIPVVDFLFGLKWSPQTALREGQVGAEGLFGVIPLFTGTLLITLIAMVVAVPIGLYSAVYMSEYASPKVRGMAKPILEILAGIPTVVYGFFAAITVAPMIRNVGGSFGFDVSANSALAAGLVMGIMIIPFISSLSDDVMNAVPQSLRDGAYALGATKSETIKQVVLPAALPGIVSSVLLAVSRAIGETMIVVMAAGLAANLTANPLKAVTTVTVQMVTMLTGDQEFDSAKTLSVFALGLLLFFVTLALNVVALKVVKHYRERYD